MEAVLDNVAGRMERTLRNGGDVCPEQFFSISEKFLERFGSRKGQVGVILFDWATRLVDMLITPQGSGRLREWGEAYQFPLVPRKPLCFEPNNNLDYLRCRENWISPISLCMMRKPPEIAAGECGAEEGSTQPWRPDLQPKMTSLKMMMMMMMMC